MEGHSIQKPVHASVTVASMGLAVEVSVLRHVYIGVSIA